MWNGKGGIASDVEKKAARILRRGNAKAEHNEDWRLYSNKRKNAENRP